MRAGRTSRLGPQAVASSALILRSAHGTNAHHAGSAYARVSKDGGGHRSLISLVGSTARPSTGVTAVSKAEEDARSRLGSKLPSWHATSLSPVVRLQSHR